MTATATATQTATVYRTFTTQVENGVFVITQTGVRTDRPTTWLCTDGKSDTGAWLAARACGLPVVVTLLDGTVKHFYGVFSAAQFEMAAYTGYVGYELSMTDGYYAPLAFESWVKSFRRDQGRQILRNNDNPQYVKDALPLYQASL